MRVNNTDEALREALGSIRKEVRSTSREQGKCWCLCLRALGDSSFSEGAINLLRAYFGRSHPGKG